MIKKILVPAFLLAFLMGATSLSAGPHDSSSVSMKDSLHQKWFAQLNLTGDQKAKMKALREEMRSLRKANREKMKALLDKSKEELLKAAPNKTVLYGIAKEMGDLHKAMSEHMADHLLKVKAILSKEQFEKMLSKDFMKGKREQGMRKGPGKDGSHGMGGHGPGEPDDDD
jgi:Spy/CpxP family protein refolding chaperone